MWYDGVTIHHFVTTQCISIQFEDDEDLGAGDEVLEGELDLS